MRLRIKDILNERGLSLSDLGDMIGVKRSSITTTINNDNPTIDTLQRIAEALNLPIIELFSKEDNIIENETMGIIRHNGSSYEINSISDIEKLLQEIKGKEE